MDGDSVDDAIKGMKEAMKAGITKSVSSANSTVAESAGLKPNEIKLAFASQFPPKMEQDSRSSLNSRRAAVGVESYVAESKAGASKLQELDELVAASTCGTGDLEVTSPGASPKLDCLGQVPTKAVLLGRPSTVNSIVGAVGAVNRIKTHLVGAAVHSPLAEVSLGEFGEGSRPDCQPSAPSVVTTKSDHVQSDTVERGPAEREITENQLRHRKTISRIASQSSKSK